MKLKVEQQQLAELKQNFKKFKKEDYLQELSKILKL